MALSWRSFASLVAVFLVVLPRFTRGYVSPLAETRAGAAFRRSLFTHVRQDDLQLSREKSLTQVVDTVGAAPLPTPPPTFPEQVRSKRSPITGRLRPYEVVLNDTHTTALVHWTGKEHSDVVGVLTFGSGSAFTSMLYVSRNYGQTYTTLQFPIPSGHARPTHMQTARAAKTWYIFADTFAHTIWTSRDDLLTLQRHLLTAQPAEISTHPTDPLTAMFLSKDAYSYTLHITHDFFQTVSFTKPGIQQFYWGSLQPYETNNTIYATTAAGIVRTDDYFKTFTLLHAGGYDLIVKDRHLVFLYKAQGAKYSSLMIRYKDGPIQAATFPKYANGTVFVPKEYFLAEILEDSMFVCVNHYSNLTNLYTSSYGGADFSFSLERVFYHNPNSVVSTPWFSKLRPDRFVDWHVVSGFSNVIITLQFEYARVGQRRMRTLITYDKGGFWSPIPAPDKDARGNPIECALESGCSLQLNNEFASTTRGVQAILSSESAPGLLMALGNIGAFYETRSDFFMSTDNGLTWRMVDSGEHGFAAGDHGGVLISTASRYSASNAFKYSLDGGNTWTPLIFGRSPLQTFHVITEPGERSSVFTLVGYFARPGSRNVSLVSINMRNAFDRTCEPTDYYPWHPATVYDELYEPGASCNLGSYETIMLRKPSSLCFNSLEFERPRNITPCNCTRDDFECDVNYILGPDDISCLLSSYQDVIDAVTKHMSCRLGANITVSRGYRKVAGTKCQGGAGSSYSPAVIPCTHPTTTSPSLSGRIVLYDIRNRTMPRLVTSTTIRNSSRTVKLFAAWLGEGSATTSSAVLRWSFGDGSQDTFMDSNKTMEHTFPKAGIYAVVVGGGSFVASVTVVVHDPLPDALVLSMQTYSQGSTVGVNTDLLFTAHFSQKFPEDDRIRYSWSFCMVVEKSCSHVYSVNTTSPIFHRKFESTGSYAVTVSAIGPINTVRAHLNFHINNVQVPRVMAYAASTTALTIGWTFPGNSAAVRIRVNTSGSEIVRYADQDANSFVFTGLLSGKTYTINVATIQGLNYVEQSATAMVRTPAKLSLSVGVRVNTLRTAVIFWEDTNPGRAGYEVTAMTRSWSAVRNVSASTRHASFAGVSPTAKDFLFFSVTPWLRDDTLGEAAVVLSAFVTPTGAFLFPPQNMVATQVQDTTTVVSWDYNVAEATTFLVEVLTSTGVKEFETKVTSRFIHAYGLKPGHMYTYRVSPVCLDFQPWCNGPSADITLEQKPLASMAMNVVLRSVAMDTITVSWDYPARMDHCIKGFHVLISGHQPAPGQELSGMVKRCAVSLFSPPICSISGLHVNTNYRVRVVTLLANTSATPVITSPMHIRIPEKLATESRASDGTVTIEPANQLASANTKLSWPWAAATLITITASGSSEPAQQFSVASSKQTLLVLLFPSTHYRIAVQARFITHTLQYRTPPVLSLPFLGVFKNVMNTKEMNRSTIARLRATFQVLALDWLQRELLASKSKRRLSGGTFMKNHFYMILDSGDDADLFYDASLLQSDSGIRFEGHDVKFSSLGRMQWVDALRITEELNASLSKAKPLSHSFLIKKYVLPIGILAAILGILLLIVLMLYTRLRMEINAFEQHRGSVSYRRGINSGCDSADHVSGVSINVNMGSEYDAAGSQDDVPLLDPN